MDTLKKQIYATIAAVQEEVVEAWLIERKQQDDGKQFFTGKEWGASALQAARFATKEDAQSVIDRLQVGVTVLGTPDTMRGYAYPVEHAFVNVTAALVEAATLKTVYNALNHGGVKILDNAVMNSLAQGKMPEGWEK